MLGGGRRTSFTFARPALQMPRDAVGVPARRFLSSLNVARGECFMRTIEMQFPPRPDLAENSSTRERWTNLSPTIDDPHCPTRKRRPGSQRTTAARQCRGIFVVNKGKLSSRVIRVNTGRDAAGVFVEKSSRGIPGNVMKITGNFV